MNVPVRVALILMLAFGSTLAAPPSTRPGRDGAGRARPEGTPDPQPQVGGDTIATATVISALPYSDAGNTCGYANDYDETCPYSGSTSGDVVYRYTAPTSEMISIELCMSSYDTKLYVYENAYTPGSPYLCNDDACSGPNYPEPYLSSLDCVWVDAGSTYYIVVDGYGGSCGNYELSMTECLGPCFGCPPGAYAEGEPDCGPQYVDEYNGGCNSTPPVFTDITCLGDSITICGSYGGFLYDGEEYRDTDWYRIDVPVGGLTDVNVCLRGSYPTILGYIDGRDGCPVTGFTSYTITGACQDGCLDLDLPEGPAWIFVATSGFGPGFECGSWYYFTVQGLQCPVAVEPATWARIKAAYAR